MKTFNQFLLEAYSRAERQSHIKPKPVKVYPIRRSIRDTVNGKVKHFPYAEVLPNVELRHNTPIIPTGKPNNKPMELEV